MLIGTRRTVTLLAIPAAALAGWVAGLALHRAGVRAVPYPSLVPAAVAAGVAALAACGARGLAAEGADLPARRLALAGFGLVWLVVVFGAGYLSVPLGYPEETALPQAVLPILVATAAALLVGAAALGRDEPLRHAVWVAALAVAIAAAIDFVVLLASGVVL